MTDGNPLRIIILFSIPILIGNIFQQLYNVIDTAVIGNVLGDNALAAVGATAPIYSLIVGFSNGITNGFAVVLARFFGAKNEIQVKKTVSLTVVLTIIVSCILTVVSLIGLNPLLKFLNTPDNIISQSREYLKIILAFSAVTMIYNMFAGMLRAIGNSKAPLYFLIVSTIVNIVLDIIFVKYLEMGVVGAAYATVIAQIVSIILCIVYILKKCPLLKPYIKYLEFDKSLISELSSTGLSMGLMLAIVSIGSVALQSAVNGFGAKTIAAHTTARKIDDIFMLPLGTLSMTAATFTSQNYGAGNMERVKKGIKLSIMIAFIWSAISCIVVFLFGTFMIKAITGTTDTIIIDTALKYIHINIPFFFVLSILLVMRSSLQGMGRKVIPLSASIIELLGKFVAVGFIAPVLGYLGVCILEPAIWIVCAIIVVTYFVFFVTKNLELKKNP